MSVSNLKQDLASLISMGRAGCVAGVIVSEYMWEKLEADFDGEFNGRIGVSGAQGNRKLRYEFYVLMSPTFPKDRFHSGYFLTPFSAEEYRDRILGHEADLVGRSETLFGWTFEERDPLQGIIEASHPDVMRAWIHYVDFGVLLATTKKQSSHYRDVHNLVCEFNYWGMITRRPDEITWFKHPERYDYHRSDLKKAVGRLLMRRASETQFEIVGIALNGRKQIVEVVENDCRFDDVHKFVALARRYFLPEEVLDFLAQFGLTVDEKELELDPQDEAWGHQGDEEAIGRLKKYVSSSRADGPWDLHTVSGHFVGSRDVEYSLNLCDRIQGAEWEKLEAEHFPPNWVGWPDTAQDKSLKAFAEAWANS